MKKKTAMKAILLFTVLVSLVTCLFACGKKGGEGGDVNVLDDPSSGVTVRFTVDFDSNGGSAVPSATVLPYGTMTEPAAPTREGYVFDGWYVSKELFTKWDFSKDLVSTGMTLYAKWTLKDVVYVEESGSDKRFSFSGGECSYRVSVETETLDLTSSLVFRDPNYRFRLYYDAACESPAAQMDEAVFALKGGANVYYLKIMDSGLKTVQVVRFTVYKNKTYLLRFYVGDAEIGTIEAEEGGTVQAPPEYVITGYDVSWYDGETLWVFGSGGTKVSQNVRLNAAFTLKRYEATFDPNGGTTTAVKQTVTFNERAVFPVPVKEDAKFLGWFNEYGLQITDASGEMLNEWNADASVTLYAHWEGNALSFAVTRKVGAVDMGTTVTYPRSGDVVTLRAYEYAVNFTGSAYELYAFGGWYDGTRHLTFDRTYTEENVTVSRSLTEQWYKITAAIEHRVGDAESGAEILSRDLIVTFGDNADLYEYDNVTVGDTVSLTASCVCGGHTFVKWSNEETTEKIVIRVTASDRTVVSRWVSYAMNVKKYLDGAETDLAEIEDAVSGEKIVRIGERVTLSVTMLPTYTFGGWEYEDDSGAACVSYDDSIAFTMRADKSVSAKWYTTQTYYRACTDWLDTYSRIRVDVSENRVGGTFRLDPFVVLIDGEWVDAERLSVVNTSAGEKAGFVKKLFVGLRAEGSEETEVLTREALAGLVFPEEPTVWTCEYRDVDWSVGTNRGDGGPVGYSINGSERIVTSTYGEDVTWGGLVSGDSFAVTARTYDDMVWLGWWKNGAFYTEDDTISVSHVSAVSTQTGAKYEACWKPMAYTVNVTSGLFATATPTYLSKGVYYTYTPAKGTTDVKDEGLYALEKPGLPKDGTTYYTYDDGNKRGGTQTVTASVASDAPGEIIRLSADVRNGFRFDGWYDESDALLTFDRTYEFHVKDIRSEYRAKYTALSGYRVTATAFRDLDAGIDPTNIGEVKLYAYKKMVDGACREYCRIEATTVKSEITGGQMTGYCYLGLYRSNAMSPTYSSLLSGGDPENSAEGFDEEIFGYGYTVDVTVYLSSATTLRFYALWDTGSYFRPASVRNTDSDAGAVYYMGYGEELILVAEPKNGYVFEGWTADETLEERATIYRFDEFKDVTYYARWKGVNESTRTPVYVVGETTREEGGYRVTGYTNATSAGSNEILVAEASVNNGYAFLGWYSDDKLITESTRLRLVREMREDEQILRVYGGSADESLTSSVFTPKWKKSDAKIVVESIGHTTITGYMKPVEGEPDAFALTYRFKTDTPVAYGVKDAGDYRGYFFDGWYRDDALLTKDYALELSAEEVKASDAPFFAKWSSYEVTVTISTSGANAECSATYAFYNDEGDVHLVLYAQVGNGYRFNGWERVNPETGERLVEEYGVRFDRLLVAGAGAQTFIYDVSFSPIESADCYPMAYTQAGLQLSAPTIYGYGSKFVVTAPMKDGYVFLGWKSALNNSVFLTKDATYEYDDQKVNGEPADPVVAVYSTWSQLGYTSISVTATDEDFSEFGRAIRTYGYYVNDALRLEIGVDVPDGYGFAVGKIVDGETTWLAGDAFSYTLADVRDGLTYEVRFFALAQTARRHTTVVEVVNRISYEQAGYYVKNATLFEGTEYVERRAISAAFEVEGDDVGAYDIIGWYDDAGELFDTNTTTHVAAPGADREVSVSFGAYEIALYNDEETAGSVYAEGYDVIVTFDRNTEDATLIESFGTPDAQRINAGQTLAYPLTYVNKDSGDWMFGGWFTAPECEEDDAFLFDVPVKRDMTLYAQWIPMERYGADGGKRLKGNGEDKILQTTTAGNAYYYGALTTGSVGLSVTNTIGYTSVVTVGLAEEGGGIRSGSAIGRFVADGNATSRFTVEMTAGNTYCLLFSCERAGEEQTAIARLTAEDPVSRSVRDPKMPYRGSVRVVASPYAYAASQRSEADSILTTAEAFFFAGWYYEKDQRSELLQAGTLYVGEENNKFYTIHDEAIEIPYEEYATYADSDGVVKLTAKWKRYSLEIVASDRDAGNIYAGMKDITHSAPDGSRILVGHEWQMEARARTGDYTFGGWYLYDEETHSYADVVTRENTLTTYPAYDDRTELRFLCLWVFHSETGKRTVSYTVGEGINSPYNVASFSVSDTSTIILYDAYRFYYDENEKEIGYYLFEGWYREKEHKNRVETLNPQTETSDVTLYAKWGSAVSSVEVLTDPDGTQYFYFGVYPQRLVTRRMGDGIMMDNGSYDADDYRSRYRYYQQDTGMRLMSITDTLFVECNPIRWNVLTDPEGNGVVYAQADLVLDIHAFNGTTQMQDDVYSDDWEHSDLREWLAEDFYTYAFSVTEKNLLTLCAATVDNSRGSGNPAYSDKEWARQNDTDDFVYAASYYDATKYPVRRAAEYSEYATYKAGENKGYWLRTWGNSGSKTYYVTDEGVLQQRSVTDVSGVRPVIRMDTRY